MGLEDRDYYRDARSKLANLDRGKKSRSEPSDPRLKGLFGKEPRSRWGIGFGRPTMRKDAVILVVLVSLGALLAIMNYTT